MKVAIVGSGGQLGSDVVRAFRKAGHQVMALSHAEIEVTDQDSVRGTLEH